MEDKFTGWRAVDGRAVHFYRGEETGTSVCLSVVAAKKYCGDPMWLDEVRLDIFGVPYFRAMRGKSLDANDIYWVYPTVYTKDGAVTLPNGLASKLAGRVKELMGNAESMEGAE